MIYYNYKGIKWEWAHHLIPLEMQYIIYGLLIVFSFFILIAPLEMVALATSRIYLIIYLIDITNIDKWPKI